MTRPSRTDRAQTEPLAALVAVAAFCLALGLYAGYVTDTLPGTSERALEEPAAEHIWHEIAENGRYDAARNDGDLTNDIDARVLPQGYVVQVNVTVVRNGTPESVGWARFDERGSGVDRADAAPAPDDARERSRPVPVRTAPGDVESGTLTVTVWG